MIIWLASIYRSNWTTFLALGWQYAYFDSKYTNSKINLKWLKRIFDLEIKKRINKKSRVLICDGFETHETLKILKFCFKNNILLYRLPFHTFYKLQFCDITTFAPLETTYRDQINRLEKKNINTINKKHFISLYNLAKKITFTSKNIKVGFAANGLFPFNPDKIFKNMLVFSAESIVLKIDEMKMRFCRQDIEP